MTDSANRKLPKNYVRLRDLCSINAVSVCCRQSDVFRANRSTLHCAEDDCLKQFGGKRCYVQLNKRFVLKVFRLLVFPLLERTSFTEVRVVRPLHDLKGFPTTNPGVKTSFAGNKLFISTTTVLRFSQNIIKYVRHMQ